MPMTISDRTDRVSFFQKYPHSSYMSEQKHSHFNCPFDAAFILLKATPLAAIHLVLLKNSM